MNMNRDADQFRREYMCDPLDREAVFTREEVAWLLDHGTIGLNMVDTLLCLYYDGEGRMSRSEDGKRIEGRTRLEIYRLKNTAHIERVVGEVAEELGRSLAAYKEVA